MPLCFVLIKFVGLLLLKEGARADIIDNVSIIIIRWICFYHC